MAAEFIVAGRRPLPAHAGPWQLVLEDDRGGIAIDELAALYAPLDIAGVEDAVAQVVGFSPSVVVVIRKAWDLAQVVAEELATALEGVVYCDYDDEVFFDARVIGARSVESIEQLEHALAQAFRNPDETFARWAREDEARHASEASADPAVRAANDWTDI